VGVLCLLLWACCVCYCVGCVSYCVGVLFVVVGVVFVIVIFVSLFKFNNVVYDKVGTVSGWSFISCCLCQFVIGALDKGLLDLSMSHFFCPSFCVSAMCLKCTEHVDCNNCVVQ